jgi:hypothetical protein
MNGAGVVPEWATPVRYSIKGLGFSEPKQSSPSLPPAAARRGLRHSLEIMPDAA